jgi:hypothetical protein
VIESALKLIRIVRKSEVIKAVKEWMREQGYKYFAVSPLLILNRSGVFSFY